MQLSGSNPRPHVTCSAVASARQGLRRLRLELTYEYLLAAVDAHADFGLTLQLESQWLCRQNQSQRPIGLLIVLLVFHSYIQKGRPEFGHPTNETRCIANERHLASCDVLIPLM